MKIDFELDETNIKQRIYTFIIPLVLTIFIIRFSKSMKNCVKRQNLKMKTFSQYLGKHQRNIFTAKETLYYFLFYTLTIFTDNASIILFQLNRDHLDKNTQFLIHNIIWVFSLEGFFGLYVPIKHIILSRKTLPSLWSECKAPQTTQFYIREQHISPRRDLKLASSIFHETKTRNKIYKSYTKNLSKSHRKRKEFKEKMINEMPSII